MRRSGWITGALGALALAFGVTAGAQASVNAAFTPHTGPGVYAFGKVSPGSTHTTTFQLKNSGTSKTPTLHIAITGSSKFAKTTDTCKGKSLAHNQACKVAVKFTPGSAKGASYSATLTAEGPSNQTLASLTLTGSTSGSSTACVIKDGSTSYSTLEAAQTAAAADDTLTVKGTCVGNAELTKDLTITGVGTNPTLQGDGTDSVLRIDAAAGQVFINSLIITGGQGNGDPAVGGGGIYNAGGVTLTGVTVTGNHSQFVGGGISNAGALDVFSSTISGNSALTGGGIYSAGAVTVSDSVVTMNTASDGAAGIDIGSGGATLEGTTQVSHNTGGEPGGVQVASGSSLTLDDTASIADNTSDQVGGGLFNIGITTLTGDSSISGNTASTYGGGVYNTGALDLDDSSSISGNTAGTDGGGVDNAGGTVTLNGGTISGNTPDDCVSC
jgi:Cep192 domain 4